MSDMFRMTLDIPADEHKRLKTFSAIQGVSMRDIILGCVREKLNPHSEGMRQTLAAIENVRNQANLVECKDAVDLFRQLGI